MTDSHIHKFKSGNGRYVFACEVQGNRVHTAQAPTELGGNPQINYSRNDEIYTFRVRTEVDNQGEPHSRCLESRAGYNKMLKSFASLTRTRPLAFR
jgi:hypothetical protein